MYFLLHMLMFCAMVAVRRSDKTNIMETIGNHPLTPPTAVGTGWEHLGIRQQDVPNYLKTPEEKIAKITKLDSDIDDMTTPKQLKEALDETLLFIHALSDYGSVEEYGRYRPARLIQQEINFTLAAVHVLKRLGHNDRLGPNAEIIIDNDPANTLLTTAGTQEQKQMTLAQYTTTLMRDIEIQAFQLYNHLGTPRGGYRDDDAATLIPVLLKDQRIASPMESAEPYNLFDHVEEITKGVVPIDFTIVDNMTTATFSFKQAHEMRWISEDARSTKFGELSDIYNGIAQNITNFEKKYDRSLPASRAAALRLSAQALRDAEHPSDRLPARLERMRKVLDMLGDKDGKLNHHTDTATAASSIAEAIRQDPNNPDLREIQAKIHYFIYEYAKEQEALLQQLRRVGEHPTELTVTRAA